MRSVPAFVLLFFSVSLCQATQQAVVAPANTALQPSATLSGNAFTSLTNLRLEFRVSNFNASTYGILWNFGSPNGIARVTVYFNSGALYSDTYRDGPNTGGYASLASAGTDIRVRIQESGASATTEIWNADGSNYQVTNSLLSQPVGAFNPTGAIRLFGNYIDGSQGVAPGTELHFLRVYSTVIPENSMPPADVVSTSADLLSYAFDGNLLDNSQQQINLSSSSPQYVASTIYPPIASFSVPASMRAGAAAQLSGTQSFASGDTDGLPTQFEWQCLQSPGPFRFVSGAHAAQSFMQTTLWGDYRVQLTVTDANGLSGIAVADVGAVSTDSQNRVISPLPAYDTLLLPMIMHGSSPWPFFDNNFLTATNLLAAAIPTTFEGDAQLSGTVTATINSTNIGGNGTHFTTDFAPCDGNENIVFQYPLADGTTGRRVESVMSCSDDTHMVVNGPWWRNPPDPGSGPDGTPTTMPYGKLTNTQQWEGSSDNWDYYDTVTAFYREWLRTGQTSFRDAARNLAGIFWKYPIDKGIACQDTGFDCSPPRVLALQGIILYFLESGNATAGDWQDLYDLVQLEYNAGYGYASGLSQPAGTLYQAREDGFVFWWCALMAQYYPSQYDPTGAMRATMLGYAENMFSLLQSRLQSGTDALGPASKGAWIQNEEGNGYGPHFWSYTSLTLPVSGTVNLTLQSGFAYSFVAGQSVTFYADANDYFTCLLTSISGTSLSCTVTASVGSGTYASWTQTGDLGFGSLPWHAFAILHGMRVLYGLAPSLQSQILSLMITAANFLNDQGWDANCKGIRYSVLFRPDVGGGLAANCTWSGGTLPCNGDTAPSGCPPLNLTYPTNDRPENMPLSWLWGWLYSATGDTYWLNSGEQKFGATFGGGLGGPYDDGGSGTFADLALYGTSAREGKTLGEGGGNGAGGAYLAWRLGTPPASTPLSAAIYFHLPPKAASASITVTEPASASSVYTCSSSPCTISYDPRQAVHMYSIAYLTSNGTTVASSSQLQRLQIP